MYEVTLIHLASDARTAATLPDVVDRPGLSGTELKALLGNFTGLDPMENAAVEPEIRVRARHGNFLIRLGHKKLVLYDVLRRDLPGHPLDVGEIMAELDGTARDSRDIAQLARVQELTKSPFPAPQASTLPDTPSRVRIAALAATACVLLGALAWVAWPEGDSAPRTEPVASAELPDLLILLAGVYLTGSEPGQHGIALTTGGELTLFELRAIAAPRVLHPDSRAVRRDGRLFLSTDQPGGLIEVSDPDTLLYCGETYRRIR